MTKDKKEKPRQRLAGLHESYDASEEAPRCPSARRTGRSSRLRCLKVSPHRYSRRRRPGAGIVKPEFSTMPGRKPASGRWNGRNVSAFHVRQEQDGKPEYNVGPGGANGDLSTRQAPISLTMRADQGGTPSGRTNALVSTSVGVERTRRRGAVRFGCQTGVAAKFRVLAAGFRRRALFRGPWSPIKSDAGASGRIGSPFGRIVMHPSSPVLKGSNPSTWGRNGTL